MVPNNNHFGRNNQPGEQLPIASLTSFPWTTEAITTFVYKASPVYPEELGGPASGVASSTAGCAKPIAPHARSPNLSLNRLQHSLPLLHRATSFP